MNRCDCPTELDEERLQPILDAARKRDRLLIVIGFETGLRISELLGLRVADVWQAGSPVKTLRVARRRLKGGCGVRASSVKTRVIPLNGRAMSALLEHFENHPPTDGYGPLFPSREGVGKSITRRQATRIIRKIFLLAGMDPSRTWASHSLRRRFVTRIYDQTHDLDLARAAIGHRWVTTTQIYLGLDDEAAAAAILQLGVKFTTEDSAVRIRSYGG